MNWVDFKNLNKDLFRSKEFLHVSFWVLLYFFLILIDDVDLPTWFKMIRHLIDISFWIIIVYVNILYLIPKYLQNKKPIIYLLSLILLVILISPIATSSMILLYKRNTEDVRQFIDNQSILALINLFVGLA